MMRPSVDLKEMTPAEIDVFCERELGRRRGQGLRVAVQLYRKRRWHCRFCRRKIFGRERITL